MSFNVNGAGMVNFAGLASGLDTNAIVKAMMQVQALPIEGIRQQEELLAAHAAIYKGIATSLTNLSAVCQTMDNRAEFMALSATSSSPAVVSATAGTGTNPGTYNVLVKNIAQAQRTYSVGVASATQSGLFGTGSITMQVGSGAAVNLAVDNTTTLESLAATINGLDEAVDAGIVFDGTNYHLQISGTQTGAANAITFAESGTTLDLANASNTPQAATDATIVLDNYVTINSSTNIVANAILGVTLQLNGASTTAQTITVGLDQNAITNEAQNFVNAYNQAMQFINANAMYDGKIDQRKLVGDTTIQNLVLQMQSVITSPVSGTTGSFQALSQLGFSTNADGTLALDTAAFQAALATDPNGLAQVFTDKSGTVYQMEKLADAYALGGTGLLSQMVTSIQAEIWEMDGQIAKMTANLDVYEQSLRERFQHLEDMMSKLKSQGQYLLQSLAATASNAVMEK